MKLPANTIIPREKATDYLLIPQARGDKSAFLKRAGYTLQNAEQLLRDLRVQLLVIAVPESALEPLREDEVCCVRFLG
jgi:hypothetical protein